jgi:hypothetical protein
MINPRPVNLFNPVRTPIGRPMAVAIMRAVPETLRDKKIILNSSESR